MNSLFNEKDLSDLKPKKIAVAKKTEKKIDIDEILKIKYDSADPEDLVHLNEKFSITSEKELQLYESFTEENYPYSINFYDFEVFKYDWMVVIINPVLKQKRVIVNDNDALRRYYRRHKKEVWCGFNSNNYDTYILKGLLLDMNPKRINDLIINYGLRGFQINDEFEDIQLYDFDIFDKVTGLKQLEGFMGNNIKETSIPFDIDRILTAKEINETKKYCVHDVEQTIEVFKRRKNDYDAQIDMINTFDLGLDKMSYTKARLTALIIGCKKKKHNDEFDLQIVDCLQLDKYKFILDWFTNKNNHDYKNSLKVNVCGVPHIFAWGGLHGCPDYPVHIKGKLFHVDVTSYYPSMMIVYDFLTRNCKDKRKYKEIYDKRVELKKAGKKKEQAPYKIILNSTYGTFKDKNSLAFDPRQANNVCVNGQLMLLDLLEHLEGHCEIIQSNTDGLIVHVEDDEQKINRVKHICHRWEKRTGMGLSFDEIDEIWQGDVNNYIFRFSNGKLERKGAYVKPLNDLDNDLPIVNEAIVKYLTEDIPVSDTINNCTEFKKFQKLVKVSSNYLYGMHNGEKLTDRTFRVFASNSSKDGIIGRVKTEGGKVEKFANTPDSCFIYNDDVNNIPVSKKLDRKWYINLAEKRLAEKFGINNQASLF